MIVVETDKKANSQFKHLNLQPFSMVYCRLTQQRILQPHWASAPRGGEILLSVGNNNKKNKNNNRSVLWR